MSTNIEFSVEVIESIAKTSPKLNGSFNLFFRINDTIGVKASLSESVRDNNFRRQELASDYGLGPEVYGKVEFNYCGKKWYGYLTEVVNTFDDSSDLSDKFDDADIDALCFELQELVGFNFIDNHEYNMGYTEDGRLVCIDFDVVFETRTEMHMMNVDIDDLELDSVRV